MSNRARVANFVGRNWPRAVMASSATALAVLILYPLLARATGAPPLPQIPTGVPPPIVGIGQQVYVVQAGDDGSGIIGMLGRWVDFLKSGGPYAVSTLALFWGWKKDKEKQTTDVTHALAAKEGYEELVALVTQQTSAMVKIDGTLNALREVISAVDRRAERGK